MDPEKATPVVENILNGQVAAGSDSDLRLRQQEILAELEVLALQGTPFPELLANTAALTAKGLEAEFCKVLEYQRAERRFIVTAGVGWGPDVVGIATVGADIESPAGYALITGIQHGIGSEPFKLVLQFLLITVVGGAVFALINTRKDDDARREARTKDEDARREARTKATQSLSRELFEIQRRPRDT